MSSPYRCTEPHGYIEPRVEKHPEGRGMDAYIRKPKTIIEVLKATVAKHGKEKAMALKRGTKVKNCFTIPQFVFFRFRAVLYTLKLSTLIFLHFPSLKGHGGGQGRAWQAEAAEAR